MILPVIATGAAAGLLVLHVAVRCLRPDRLRRRLLRRLGAQQLTIAEVARAAGFAQDAVRTAFALPRSPTALERVGRFFRRRPPRRTHPAFDADLSKALWL
jgi:hypothetical protein